MAEETGTITTGPYNVPLGDKPYSAPYTSIGQEICDNLFVEKATTETSLSPYYFVSIPGMKLLNAESTNNSAACRGLYTAGNGKVFGVWSNEIFEIGQDGTRSFIGQLLSFTGLVSFADNSFDIILVDGMAGYTVDLTSGVFAQILDEYFPGIADNDTTKAPTRVACIDTYFLVNKQNSNEYYWSTPNYIDTAFDMDNPDKKNKWNGLQFGKKIGDSDEIIGMTQAVNLLWLFGRQSIEVHYDSGDYEGQLFSRVSNALINFGCSAPNSITKFANNVFWIGSDRSGTSGIFTASTDFMPTRISTRGIESYMAAMSKYDDAISYVYAADGHAFIIFYFPTGDQTFVYDVVTQSWHRRTKYDYTTGQTSAWSALYSTYGHNMNIVGDRLGDAIFELDPTYYMNDNASGIGINYIQRIKTTPINLQMGKLCRYKTFQLIMQQGVGLINGFTDNTSRTKFNNFYNSAGEACPLGHAYFYVAGTEILLDTYNAPTGSGVNSNAVTLNGSGLATIYLQPRAYDVVIRNPDNSIFLQLKNIGTIAVGKNPKAMISWSNDSGKSWSNEREIGLGEQGRYDTRTRLTTLGTARNRVWKVRITEPVQIVIAGLIVDWDTLLR